MDTQTFMFIGCKLTAPLQRGLTTSRAQFTQADKLEFMRREQPSDQKILIQVWNSTDIVNNKFVYPNLALIRSAVLVN